MIKNKIPNFLIVGAAKCGTTSLHNYLNQHDQIFLPSTNKIGFSVKEPHFLVKDIVEHRLHFGVWNWDEYLSLFNESDKEKCIGEASVFYLYYYEEAIKNIKSFLGKDVKIIIILRNPIDRAYSAFNHVSRSKKENLSFEEALLSEENRLENDKKLTPMVMYKSMGLYYNMVKAYKDNFKNVHIVLHESFKNDSDNVMKNIFNFLKIDDSIVINSNIKYNIGGKMWKNKIVKGFFKSDNFLKRVLFSIISIIFPKFFRKKLIDLSMKTVKPINKKTRILLRDFYKEDIEKLSHLLNMDLTNWNK